MANKSKTNPAYGMIRISRCHGSERTLFGSSLKHNDTIRITISNGDVKRELHSDFYHEEGKILEIELSPTQFADAITGIGSAVPCTIDWQKGIGHIPMPDFCNKKTQFTKEFDENVAKSTEQSVEILDRVSELFQKKSLNKADREEILRKLSLLKNTITSNTTFLSHCFTEQMERTTIEAKGEIEAFMQQKLNDIALSALAQNTTKQELEENIPHLLEDEG